MIYSKVIIVGGGPASSTCGWKLRKNGIECLILDKQEFPRTKLCAGWITPQVISDLMINTNDYPHSLVKFDKFHVHIYSKELKIKVHQYAIRRHEFDHWLLKRCGVEVQTHEVNDIKKDGDYYVIDNQYYCKYLVGAGGTHCPVYRTFFKHISPRDKDLLVVTLEEEFPYDYHDGTCHLWFLQNKLPGYSWYVPKSNGYLNIGIGGFSEKLKANNDNIKNQWQFFVKELERLSLVKNYQFNARGYIYYIRNSVDVVQNDSLFLIGDAAGLATKDMGEGIGPAVKSGILAADAITSGKPFSLSSVKKYSFPKYQTVIKLFVAYLINQRTMIE
ncbi:MAG: NAD(P)/FAD-dependent oxidoreductase [Desulfosarcina sp.]|nr:NAD(P)/FAD-dependent oxidoreductase [Desulfobacterales bacterium]